MSAQPKKDIVTQNQNQPRALAPVAVDPENGSEILQSDILVPRIMLMQALSDMVVDDRARPGQIVRSTPFEILGDSKTPIEFIPLRAQNKWMLQEFIPGKKKAEYRGMLPRDGGLADSTVDEIHKTGSGLPWEFTYKNNKWRRVKIFEVYALLPRDIKAFEEEVRKSVAQNELPDPDKMLMPVVISFQSTSFRAGQEVATYMAKANAMKTVPYGGVFTLGCEQTSNDQGTFYIFKCEKTGKSQKEWLEQAKRWTDVLRSQRVRVDEEGLEGEGAAVGGGGIPGQF